MSSIPLPILDAFIYRFSVFDTKIVFQLLPALEIFMIQFVTNLLAPFRCCHAKRGLEHESLCAISDSLRFQFRCGSSFEALEVRSVWSHHRVQCRTAGTESALLRLVLAQDQSHELTHAVAVVVRWTERVFLHRPARRKDDEVSNRRAITQRWARQHRKNARILSNENSGS